MKSLPPLDSPQGEPAPRSMLAGKGSKESPRPHTGSPSLVVGPCMASKQMERRKGWPGTERDARESWEANTHLGPQEGRACDESPGSSVRKAAHSPQAA